MSCGVSIVSDLEETEGYTRGHNVSANYLWEISNDVRPVAVDLCQDVEEERLHIKVECLVVQEQFGQQAQILTVDLENMTTSSTHLIITWSLFS